MLSLSPKVSIIMPTFNRASYIGETIDSIRRQTYPNWELIIVDDGSTDNTGEIVSQVRDARILFCKAGRIGINGKIKNLGIQGAEGELIAFIDSDDLWAETKLEKQILALRNYPEAGFSLTGGYNFRGARQPVDFFYRQREGIFCGDILVPFFKSEISTTTPSLVFRRECLDAVPGFDETRPFSDVNYILELASHFKAVVLYEPLLYRRLHGGNDSGANWIKGYEEGISLIRSYRRKIPASVARSALFRLYINFGEDYLAREERGTAARNFFRAWKFKPFSFVPARKGAKVIFKTLIGRRPGSSGKPVAIPSKAWDRPVLPGRILAIRLQAMGDVVITLPYLQHLRQSLPASTKIDLLTRKECENIPKNISLFNKVISIGGGRNFKRQLMHTMLLLPGLLLRRYDVVIDLQNNDLTLFVLKMIRPRAWSVFDRFSSLAAGERTRLTIEAAGLGSNNINTRIQFRTDPATSALLRRNGWDGESEIVVLNPAAAFPTRNWPLENYLSFAALWLRKSPATQFLVMGTSFIRAKAVDLKKQLAAGLIMLIDQTTPAEAFAIMRHVKFVLSEDSGLMHMAWVSGTPTLALFGSTKSDWSRPLGPHSAFLDSSDLPCGNCMQEVCVFGDNHCMTRYTPEYVFMEAQRLLEKQGHQVKPNNFMMAATE